jgi:hypothetical protein
MRRAVIRAVAAAAMVGFVLAVPATAQRGGGGSGGGGGFGGGFGSPDNGPNLPVQSDFTGPVTGDSLRAALGLDSAEVAAITLRRDAHLQVTGALRDSLGRAAVVLGYAHATHPTADPADDAALGKLYDKLLQRVRKSDAQFYDKQVKPLLSRDQARLFKKWLNGEL